MVILNAALGAGSKVVPSVTGNTNETQRNVTGLVPDVRYRVFVTAENDLYDVDTTTMSTENITVTLLEGGEMPMIRPLINNS